MTCETINTLNIRRLFSVLVNFAYLVGAYNFKLPFFQSSFICFSKVKLLSIVMPGNFLQELPSITELLILMDFALKGDKNKLHFETFALK